MSADLFTVITLAVWVLVVIPACVARDRHETRRATEAEQP